MKIAALHSPVRRFGARALAANAAQFTRSPEDIWCEARGCVTLEADSANPDHRLTVIPAFPAGTLAV